MVVAFGMDALDGLWQQGNDTAIVTDIIVIAALAVHGFATGYQQICAERLVAFIGHTVDHDELD